MSKGNILPYVALVRDANGSALQTAARFTTQDISGTPKVSPLAYSSSVITIAVPDGALQFIVSPTTDMRISNDVTMTTYDLIAAGAKEALPVALMSSVYIKRDAVDGTVRFRFAEV